MNSLSFAAPSPAPSRYIPDQNQHGVVRLLCMSILFCLIPSLTLIINARMCLAEQRGRPNIVVLIADDLGYAELGCQGNRDVPTPAIDSIATHGVRFTNGYVTASFCSASRAGLMTGRYQNRFGYDFNPIGAANDDPQVGLPTTERTFAEALQDVGYATALIGKWHLGGTAAYHPQRRGFDEFFGFLHEGHYYVPGPPRGVTTFLRRKSLPDGSQGEWINQEGTLVLSTHMGTSEPDYDANNPILRDGQPVVEETYLTDALTREAVDYIHRHRDRPFLLIVAYNAVHSPMQGTAAKMQQFRQIDNPHRRVFASMLSSLDDSVGSILSQLHQDGLTENTLVTFLSDNGGPTRELTSSNGPLRGEKGQLYEGGVRVPFLMQWPTVLPAGAVEERPVLSLDLAATAIEIASARPSPKSPLDGVNLIPYLTGQNKTSPHDVLYWRQGERQGMRVGDWKGVRNSRQERAPWELYHLSDDPGENKNLASTEAEALERIQTTFQTYESQMSAPFWSPNRNR